MVTDRSGRRWFTVGDAVLSEAEATALVDQLAGALASGGQ